MRSISKSTRTIFNREQNIDFENDFLEPPIVHLNLSIQQNKSA